MAVTLEDGDIFNGAWIAWSEDAEPPVERLAAKALDSREYLRLWSESGGTLSTLEQPAEQDETAGDTRVLSGDAIAARLMRSDDQRIVVTPLFPDSVQPAALDVRLGSRFIVFQRTRTGAFDPLATDEDPRAMQRLVSREWGDQFVLHPGELVLAATLEYLVLPSDLAAQVITRSSYGRLGLVTATAIQVQPYFHGCLTLELLNHGLLPIVLTPGERIAQLVFQRVLATVERPAKYRWQTGPEFSRVREDVDSDVLRAMRESRSDQ